MQTAEIKSISEIEIGDRLIMKSGYMDSSFTAGSKFTVIGDKQGWLQLKADKHLPSTHPNYVISGIEYKKGTFSPNHFDKIIEAK